VKLHILNDLHIKNLEYEHDLSCIFLCAQ